MIKSILVPLTGLPGDGAVLEMAATVGEMFFLNERRKKIPLQSTAENRKCRATRTISSANSSDGIWMAAEWYR